MLRRLLQVSPELGPIPAWWADRELTRDPRVQWLPTSRAGCSAGGETDASSAAAPADIGRRGARRRAAARAETAPAARLAAGRAHRPAGGHARRVVSAATACHLPPRCRLTTPTAAANSKPFIAQLQNGDLLVVARNSSWTPAGPTPAVL